MILVFRDPAAPSAPSTVSCDHLLGKPGKDGEGSARGPLVEGDTGTPLAALRDGDKLHLVAPGDREAIAGLSPAKLVERLGALGLGRAVQLEQIHLLSNDSGTGGEESFARRLADALADARYQVREIKAPRGHVRVAPDGKVWIRPTEGHAVSADADGYCPSTPRLNAYAGTAVQEKHRAR